MLHLSHVICHSGQDILLNGWNGERCTVRCEDTECADQSEGATQAGLMNHLGFLGSTACDWTEGGVAGQVLEDVIGSNAGDGGV